MTDKKLFQLCKQFGAQALEARRKFEGLLPEVLRRKLYKKCKFESIHHFAAVLAGMSKDRVNRVLQLDKKFEDKPALRHALTQGEVSVNKLARIASIATKENDAELAEMSKTISKNGLETFVRTEKQNGLDKPLFAVPGHRTRSEAECHAELRRSETVSDSEHKNRIELSDEVQEKLHELQEKGININKLLLELLQKREENIENELNEIGEQTQPTKSKYIKVKTQKVLHKKHGTKCAMPSCNKDADQIHHALYGSYNKIHDPRYMIPLCKGHHEVTHTKDLIYLKLRNQATHNGG